MRIGLLIHELMVEGGTERQCLSLAVALRRLDQDVTVFTSAFDPTTCYPDLCRDLTVRVAGRGAFGRLRRPRLLRRLFDMRTLARAVLLEDAKSHFDVLNPHHWPPHWAAVWVKQQAHQRIVWACNDLPRAWVENLRGGWGRIRRIAYRPIDRFDQRMAGHVDVITALDGRMAELLVKSYRRTPVEIVRTGLDLERFTDRTDGMDVRARHGLRSDSYLLLCFAILLPHRRIEDVVRALDVLHQRGLDVQLLIAGSPRQSPSYVQKLVNQIETLGLHDDAVLAGAIPEQFVPDYYRASDAFIFPNEEQTWGLAVIEAMACGKPAVVSTGAGVHEVLMNGVTALLVPPRSPERISDAVAELIANPGAASNLARAGQQYVQKTFSWKRYAEDMMLLFASADRAIAHSARGAR